MQVFAVKYNDVILDQNKSKYSYMYVKEQPVRVYFKAHIDFELQFDSFFLSLLG